MILIGFLLIIKSNFALCDATKGPFPDPSQTVRYECSKLVGENDDLLICSNPYKILDGNKVHLSVSNFTFEQHFNLCAQFNKVVENTINWVWDIPKNSDNGTFVTQVVCLNYEKNDHLSRIKFDELIRTDDGTVVITNPSYLFNIGRVKFLSANGSSWDQYISAKAICIFLGYKDATNNEAWESDSSSYFEEIDTTVSFIPKLTLPRMEPTGFTSKGQWIWSKIFCK